jgi:hypothetical protein
VLDCATTAVQPLWGVLLLGVDAEAGTLGRVGGAGDRDGRIVGNPFGDRKSANFPRLAGGGEEDTTWESSGPGMRVSMRRKICTLLSHIVVSPRIGRHGVLLTCDAVLDQLSEYPFCKWRQAVEKKNLKSGTRTYQGWLTSVTNFRRSGGICGSTCILFSEFTKLFESQISIRNNISVVMELTPKKPSRPIRATLDSPLRTQRSRRCKRQHQPVDSPY